MGIPVGTTPGPGHIRPDQEEHARRILEQRRREALASGGGEQGLGSRIGDFIGELVSRSPGEKFVLGPEGYTHKIEPQPGDPGYQAPQPQGWGRTKAAQAMKPGIHQSASRQAAEAPPAPPNAKPSGAGARPPVRVRDPYAGIAGKAAGIGEQYEKDSAGAKDRVQTGMERQRAALELGAQAGAAQSAKEWEVLKNRQAMAADQQEAYAKMQEAQQAAVQAAKAKVDKARQEIRSTAIEDRRSLPAKLVGALAIAIGGMVSARGGGPNYALQIVNQGIERDLQEQREQLSRKKETLASYVNDLDRLRVEHKDEDQAAMLYRAQRLEEFRLKLEEVATKYKGTKQASQAAQTIGAIEQQQGQLTQQMAQQDAAQRYQQLGIESQVAGQRAASQAAQIKAAMGEPKGKQLSQTTIEKVSELEAGEKQVKDLEDAFSRLGPEAAITQFFGAFGSEAGGYERSRDIATAQMVKALSGASATDEEYARVRAMIPEASDTKATARAKFKALRAMFANKRRAFERGLKGSGYDTSGLGNPELRLKRVQ